MAASSLSRKSFESTLKKRLIYQPIEHRWKLEYLTPEGNIHDFIELIPEGVVMRFSLEEVIAGLQAAIEALKSATPIKEPMSCIQ
ncbi:MAG: hypothetical protein ACP5PV_01325 [Methanothrix sp.]